MLTHIVINREEINGGEVDSNKVYKNKVELILVSLLDLYSKLKFISMSASGLSSSSTSYCLLTTILRENVNNFSLRLFNSR